MAEHAWERAIIWMIAFAMAEQGYRVDVSALCTYGVARG